MMKILTGLQALNLILWCPLLITGKPGHNLINPLIYVNNGLISKIIPNIPKEEALSLTSLENIIISDYVFMPGMIDCHVHLALKGYNFQEALDEWQQPQEVYLRFAKELLAYQKAGILALRDGGDKLKLALTYSNDQKSLPIKILPTGSAIYKNGFYGAFLGQGVSSWAEIPPLIKAIADSGAAQLKVIISGIVSFKEYGKVGPVQWSYQELQEIVKLAHVYGLKVMGHASSHEAVALAIEAGITSIEHGYFLTSEDLKAMALTNTYWVPTIIPVAVQTDNSFKNNFSQEEIKVITKTYQLQMERVLEGFAMGVKIGIGTDAGASGVYHGTSLYQEMKLYFEAGVKAEEIIKAVTITNSELVGLNDILGELAIGKPANLVGLAGNPLVDFTALSRVEMIVVNIEL